MAKVLRSGDTAVTVFLFFLLYFIFFLSLPSQININYHNYMQRLTEEKQQLHIIQGGF